MKRQVRFGIIGCGLMGREFGSAVARWCHLTDDLPKPILTAVCDSNPVAAKWFAESFPLVTLVTSDYRELLASDVDAVYCALPHNLHALVYCDIIRAKHLMGEKPFGIDQEANALIAQAIAEHPDVFVRCSSEFPFVPAMQAMCGMIESNAFGSIIQVEAGFLHSSDLDPQKPINWKRRITTNGRYGCMGDLGLHVCHVPFRAGWVPRNVRAILSKIVAERPDGKGGGAPCETWDNATLLCETTNGGQDRFPMTLKMQRIAPGGAQYVVDRGAGHPRECAVQHEGLRLPRGDALHPRGRAVLAEGGDRVRLHVQEPSRVRFSNSGSPTRSSRCGLPSSMSFQKAGRGPVSRAA